MLFIQSEPLRKGNANIACFQTFPVQAGIAAGEVAGEVTGEVKKLLKILTKPMNRTELQAQLQLKSQANFRERYLQPALMAGFIEMTIPHKPTSSRQKYRLTAKGRTVFID